MSTEKKPVTAAEDDDVGVVPVVPLTASLDEAERAELEELRAARAAADTEVVAAETEAEAVEAVTTGLPTTITIGGFEYPTRPKIPGAQQAALASITKGLVSATAKARHANIGDDVGMEEFLKKDPDTAGALMGAMADRTEVYVTMARSVINPDALPAFEARFNGDCPDDEIIGLAEVQEAIEEFIAGGDPDRTPKS